MLLNQFVALAGEQVLYRFIGSHIVRVILFLLRVIYGRHEYEPR